MAFVIPIVTMTGGIRPVSIVILYPSSASVPTVQMTTMPMIIMEKITALDDRKKINMMRPVITTEAIRNIFISRLTWFVTTVRMNGKPA